MVLLLCRMRPRATAERSNEIAVGRARASATSPRVTRGTAGRNAPTAERSHSLARGNSGRADFDHGQKEHHGSVHCDEKFVSLLDEHGVACDARYL